MATEIPQRELRNQAGSVLRRAEAGEIFTVTVDGRPVAQLGPLPGAAAPITAAGLTAALQATPVDDDWAREQQIERDAERAAPVDPWR